jgi:hypothetical protein
MGCGRVRTISAGETILPGEPAAYLSTAAHSRNRAREMRGHYLFRAGREDHKFEVLEIRPDGLRLLVPRRTLLAAWGAALAIVYYVGSQVILSALLASRPANLSVGTVIALLIPMWLIGAPVLVGLLGIKTLPWAAAWWPRKAIPLELGAVEPHRLTHWIRVSAEGEDMWVQVEGLRRRVTSALQGVSRSPGSDRAT